MENVDYNIKVVYYDMVLDGYLNNYFKLYNKIHKKYCSKLKIILLQEEINEVLNHTSHILKDIKQAKDSKKIREKENTDLLEQLKMLYDVTKYIKGLYMSLVDDIMIKYVFKNEVSMLSSLFIDYKKNENYNYENVSEYIKIIKEMYLKKKAYYVICDLCTINLDCGDVIFRKKHEIDYKEIKNMNSPKVKEIVNAIRNNRRDELTNEKDKKQYDRIKRQFEKHERIDENLFYGPILTGRYESKMIKPKNFTRQLKKDIKKIKNKLYVEKRVDKCIEYLIINNKCKNKNKKAENKLEYLIINKYVTNGESIFDYEEFLLDSVVNRPYLLNWNSKTYKKIIKREIEIYFKVNIYNLIEEHKEKGIDIYTKKVSIETNSNHSIARNKNRNYYMLVCGEEIYLGNMFVYQVPACLYTSDDIVRRNLEIYKENLEEYGKMLKKL